MDNLIRLYQQRLNLHHATFVPIAHEDATVAIVYKIIKPTGVPLILKICTEVNHYVRELYFLNYFSDKLPVPQIIQVVPPEANVYGAIVMECLPGTLLKPKDFTGDLAHQLGALLARIHLNRAAGYGDLIQPHNLHTDPRIDFAMKFNEGLAECQNHIPKALIEQCRFYFDADVNLLDSVDGPCIVHRDFRAGNIMVSDGKLQGIIDWASCRASFAQEDFILLEHEQWSINPIGKNSFLEGYASIRQIPDYSAIMPLLRLSKAIAILGFTVKRGTWNGSNARMYQFNRQFLEKYCGDNFNFRIMVSC
jgi:Ser/Thr protein kinase RdoA (MazF antagonist)